MPASPLNVRIILVRPRNPGNIGACARAMGNFGFTDLVIVDPYLPIWNETRAAPDAEEIVRAARKTKTLKEALRACKRIYGTSSFAHRTLEQAVITLADIPPHLTKEPTAIVFGSERSGLSNEELSQCHAIIQIPMAQPKVSMNLAQAVAVVLYELTRSMNRGNERSIDSSGKEEVLQEWIALAEKVRYPAGYTPAARAGRIRQAMQQTTLSSDAARFLKSFSRWIYKKIEFRP